MNANNFLALYGLGRICEAQGNPEKAVSFFEAAVKAAPDYTEAHFQLGHLYQVQGQLDKAVKHYNAAIAFKPDFIQAANNLGMISLTKGDLEEATLHFRAVMRIRPDYRVAALNYQKANDLNQKLKIAVTKMTAVIKQFEHAQNILANMKNLIEQKRLSNQIIRELNRKPARQPGFKRLCPRDIKALQPVYKELSQRLSQLIQLSARDESEMKAMSSYLIACIFSFKGEEKDARRWLKLVIENGFDHNEIQGTPWCFELIKNPI